MKKIQMVDLQGQHQKIAQEIEQAMQQVMAQSAFINGPEVALFRENLRQFNQAKQVITCGNGTDALQIALMALDLKPEDEIIIPAFTYVATVEVAALLGLKPVLVDVDPETFNLAPFALENAITNRTKTIIPVHLFGQCADMEAILNLAGTIPVIEDAAQAIGAEYTFSDGQVKKAGCMGTIGTTSFFPSKNLGCFGDGGAIFTNELALGQKMQKIANHGQSEKYYHEVVGVNSRLDTLQAAILNVKFKSLPQFTAARQSAAAFYDQAFSGHPAIKIPSRNPDSTHVFHQYTIQVEDGRRNALKAFLQEKDIPSMIYYPVPVHFQIAFQYLGYRKGDFPVAEALCEKVLSLPMHTELGPDQLDYIVETVLEFFKN